MKTYIKFISQVFFKSLFFVFFIMTSLVFILNLLTELEFFKNENVSINFTLFISILNSPSLIFEMFPFIMLITIQLFFIKILEDKQLDIFKYSGLKNSSIIKILSFLSILTGIFVVTVFCLICVFVFFYLLFVLCSKFFVFFHGMFHTQSFASKKTCKRRN